MPTSSDTLTRAIERQPTLDGSGRTAKDLPAMEVRNVVFSYGKNQILNGVNLSVPQGKVTTILGSNGCGKSTLFSLMTKNLDPDLGKIFLRGKNIRNIGLKDFARRVSIVHQNNTAAADMTVEQLVRLGRSPHLKPMTDLSEDDERLVDWVLEVTGMDAYRLREVSRLSGGQRQRVWIAMALAQNTRILFLDEPTTYLDIRYQLDILDLVRRLNRELGITVVMVLHDINQAIEYSDMLVGLKGGKVVLAGDPQEVVTRESIQQLFDVSLEVTVTGGRKHVLLRDEVGEVSETNEVVGLETPFSDVASVRDAFGAGYPPASAESRAVEGGSAPVAASQTARGASAATLQAMETAARRRAAAEAASAEGESPAGPNPYVSQATLAAMRARGLEPAYELASDGHAQEDADAAGEEATVRKEPPRSSSRLSRALWAALGVVCFGLGTVGTVLPILPTVPLYLAALFCFAKGSQRLHDWFVGTKLYHKHLEGFVEHRGMTMRTKLSIMGTVTLVMAIAFIFMSGVPIGRIILVIVWVFHVVYFVFFIKTDKPAETDGDDGSKAVRA